MACSDFELLNIMRTLVDVIFRVGGDDDDVRMIKNCQLADQIATLVMVYTKKLQAAPIVEGLTIHQIKVDGDDPRWLKIDPECYRYSCEESARTGDFPVKPGKRLVRYVLLPFNFDPGNQKVIDDIARRNLTRPDRATTETILDAREAGGAVEPVVGVCGAIQSDTDGDSVVGCIAGGAGGRDLRLVSPGFVWLQHCQFVAVISDISL